MPRIRGVKVSASTELRVNHPSNPRNAAASSAANIVTPPMAASGLDCRAKSAPAVNAARLTYSAPRQTAAGTKNSTAVNAAHAGMAMAEAIAMRPTEFLNDELIRSRLLKDAANGGEQLLWNRIMRLGS